jgi:hypothetical protein
MPAVLSINSTDDQQHLLDAAELVVSMAITLGKAQELRSSGVLGRLVAAVREAPMSTDELSNRQTSVLWQLRRLIE